MTNLNIREATLMDYDQVWTIFKSVIEAEDTYVFSRDTPRADLEKHWFANYMSTYIVEDNNELVGTYILKPNQMDLGNHIANCSYMVDPNSQGKGIGKLMCEHSIMAAKDKGFKSIQFNIVVSSNIGAIKLWEKFGFKIIGTTPNGFRHSQLGYVDTYIMYKEL